ncbi:hypothetical protein C0Q70_20272 [Pomacea canaliculata]|uniref:RAVE complex protein Rav1 C-terminal domain-containing protein n=1 Tax=Pomacea canaliculata TaxID=400727 RepID=A0A2T7NF43_POMCA|nr:hypothetical protein C0Q70_20272 [Pomacea canaliculata]
MNRHQVLTGSCNPGDNCYAVGSVEGVHFTAYAAGCNIVILAGNFERVQIIPGVAHGNIKVTCIDCSTDTGKIAASYGKKVYIFEPTPLVSESSHRLDYRWYKTAEIETECYINNLSWNMEGSKLLTGGELIQIWQLTPDKGGQGDTETEEPGTKRVHFSLGDSSIAGSGDPEEDAFTQRLSHVLDPAHHGLVHDPGTWQCVWKCRPATPVYHLQFSPDGFLFASAGKADRLVKIWYEDQKVQRGLSRSDSISPKRDTLHYSFVYISHPRAVTGFTWRRTSKYMPRGAVANMLVTSCLDNVCRIWVETILPDDGLVDLEQVEPSLSHDIKHHAHRHKKRFLQRLRTIRHAIHKRRKHKYGPETVMSTNALNSMGSVHDFHRFAIHHNGVSPVLHFHLAGSINPYTDIPLSPVSGNQYSQHNFRLHWLDNKELQFTMEAERLLQELHTKLVHEDTEQGAGAHLGGDETGDSDEHDDDGDGEHEQHFASFGQETYDKDDDVAKKRKHKLFKRKKLSKGESNKTVVQSDSQTSLSSEHDSEDMEKSGSILERLDHNIEMLLKEWQSTSDMLFSIHPVDGSFLVWLVEWLDEGLPFTFRQAQISFSSCLPHAIPVPDAATMSCNLLLYCNYSRMDIKSVMHISEVEEGGVSASNAAGVRNNHIGANSMDMLIPNVLLVSKHNNGTLNQWQISFTESSMFQTVVSVAHAARVCGHRFRTNAAACHPVLPLLLTTSHHNLPDPDTTPERETSPEEEDGDASKSLGAGVFAFCSELILWQVNSVGPLSKSGGLMELARINSPSTTAFTSMAWVPTLLPSTTLGSCSNSPSALFVASDGASLRLYQAVIDARALLTESKPAPNEQTFSFSSASSSYCPDPGSPPQPLSQIFHVASLQSSARPGCIIELDTINDATADWQNIQLLHVFQEALVTGQQHQSSSSTAFRPESANVGDTMGAYVDLSRSGSFLENFYLVVLERLSTVIGDEGSRVHMWQITISSQPNAPYHDGNREKDYGSMDDGNSDEEEALYYHDSQGKQETSAPVMKMSITTCKVCTQTLFLPTGVHVISANVAAGHLSSASIYPACFAPYLLTTACSDGQLRFWKCTVSEMAPSVCRENSLNVTNYEFSSGLSGLTKRMSTTSIQQWQPQKQDYEWEEWQMICSKRQSSSIIIPGKPITVSCAYSGRIAVAYRYGDIRAQPNHPEEKFINLYVAIFECESTGGSEWVLEDTIELKDIKIPDPQVEIELSQVMLTQQIFPPGLSLHNTPFSDIPGLTPTLSSAPMVSMPRTKSVPSLSTIQSVRKSIAEQGNKLGLLKQKCLVQLDWVATEDGSHILTVGVGTKIFTYTQVSDEVAQASIKANAAMAKGVRENTPTDIFHRPLGLIQKSKSLVIEDYQEEIRWMRLRVIELETADGLPPLPMHMSWVRTGILVVGMDNEIHVYTQWRGSSYGSSSGPATAGSSEPQMGEELTADKRTLTEANLASMASSAGISKGFKSVTNFKSTLSTPNIKHAQSLSLHKRDSTKSLSLLLAMLTQFYHNTIPSSLTALLNFGKIRRVKAILAHLLRCIGGFENFQDAFVTDGDTEDGVHHHGRTWSISLNTSGGNPEDAAVIPDVEDFPDFLEVSSIPPLPIYALISADADNTVLNTEIANVAGTADQGHPEQDYTDLFNTQIVDETEELDLSSSLEDTNKKRRHQLVTFWSANPYAFLPAHSKLLGRQLMRISLPGLSSLDQMYLVALADTVAHTKMDFADRFQQDDIKEANESMDDCGLRFLLAVRQHIYLLSTLPPTQRAILQHQGLQSYFLVWAFHSEATEELLSMIPCMQKEKPTWDELRQFGAGWSVENQRMADFFKNDFGEDRWRKAALKNAFALLGKQMFREAAAFFLLGDSLKDADNTGRKTTNNIGDPDTASTKPNIFNFYNYLRTHPLLLRLQLSATSLKKRRAILTGFTRANSVAVSDKITTIDRVTPTERRLFFATAHTHFKNGCPFLALEVLSKLPPVVEADIEKEQEIATQRRMSLVQGSISTGTLQEDVIEESDESSLVSKPSDNGMSGPFINGDADQSNKIKLDLTLSSHSDEEEEEEDADILAGKHPVKIELTEAVDDYEHDDNNTEDAESSDQKIDIMAQQFKFIACLKVMMEELSTLATGFEVDGGQLRYQLYVWLEKEVEVLKVLCNYGQTKKWCQAFLTVRSLKGLNFYLDTSQDSDDFETLGGRQRNLSFRSDTSRASLHEVILADKQDLESKERRLAKRKSWLKQNQHLLRTLISYSILQGSSGGGLASVRMELLLLLQELQQERPQQQLLSPLPFPTTLPLLSASLASSRTVIADPIQHLQGLTQDLLHSLIEMTIPPGVTSSMAQVVTMRNLSVSLSSCIYQCLCDSDSFYVNMARTNDPGLEGFTNPALMMASSSLMAGIMKTRHRTDSSNTDEVINTHPAKWPGVTSLHVLLMREKDEDAPKLHVMLCEALLAVYVTLLVTGLATYDPQILYRLLANKLDQQSWGALFGGGVKTVLKVEKNIPKVSGDRISQQRLKFNMRVMAPMKETYKERFVAPELSMISYFMTKPFISSNESIISYDSDDSVISDAGDGQSVASDEEEEEEEEETERPKSLLLSGQKEHSDPSSYSWCLMRFAILRAVLSNLRTFLPQVGIEITELPIVSPMLHALVRQLERWEAILQSRLDMFSGAPDNYIAGLTLDTISGMPGSKLQALFNPNNTPFIKSRATLPIKRLWFQLLRQENLQEIFLRYVFRRSHKNQVDENDSMKTSSSEEGRLLDPMKVVHKEQDIITSFAINQDNGSILALATQKELVELDIGLLLRPPAWLSDDNEFDIETLRNPKASIPESAPEFLVIHTPQDTLQPHSGSQTPSTPYAPSPLGSSQNLQTGRGASMVKSLSNLGVHNPVFSHCILDRSRRLINVILRRVVSGVRRIGSHPTLSYYLTGSADGCVRLWEWGHGQPVATLRQPGTFPKVTKVLFNAQGNKCCISDIEGAIGLWQIGLGSNFNKPIMSLPCHNKTTSDFAFLGCSSLIATAGHSSESKNVCLWDTLLPPRSCLVHAFTCHEHGSPAVVYAPQRQLLISGGRKGEICIFDMRQRQLRHTFQAHESAIKCLTLDSQEEYFVTGSAEGDIKVWGLDVHQLIFSFPGEHSKNTFFRTVGSTSGVTQVAVGPANHLFSCGVDGSIKFRQLPEKEVVVHHWV